MLMKLIPGRDNVNVTYFSQVIITSQLSLGDITYTANGAASRAYPLYNDGHYVSFEIELFGCDSYVIDAGGTIFIKTVKLELTITSK
jgi:hypothetical protein